MHRAFRSVSKLLIPAIVASTVLFGCQQLGGGAQFPSRPIEMVVSASAGGGSDIMARHIAGAIETDKLLSQSVAVVNKVGGNNAIGFQYVKNAKPDGHTVGVGNDNVVSGQLRTKAEGNQAWDYKKDFTLLARLATDTQLICVNADSPYKTLKDLIEAAKANPKQIKVAGTTSGGSDDLFLLEVQRSAGVEFNYVLFKGGGESLTAMLGGHVDALVTNPTEASGQLEAKKIRALGVADHQRWPGLDSVPTLKEQGINVTLFSYRGLIAPANLDKNALKTWQEVLKKVDTSQFWAEKYVKGNMLRSAYLVGPDFEKFVDEQYLLWEKAYKDLGLIK